MGEKVDIKQIQKFCSNGRSKKSVKKRSKESIGKKSDFYSNVVQNSIEFEFGKKKNQ